MKKLFRALAFSLGFFLCSLSLHSQWVTIPDTAFVSYLQATFPSCMNGNQMDTTCNAIVTAKGVYCSHRPIKDITGIQYFDLLDTLNCSYDSIAAFPNFPATLKWLNCGFSNSVISLPALPAGFNYLYCPYNKLTSLPVLPANMNTLYCSHNPLVSLPALPNTIKFLYCEACQLTSLPALPTAMTFFYCGSNSLTTIPALPSTIYDFECGFNQLSTLPALPAGMRYLVCSYNQLTSLPALPSGMAGGNCYCSHNLLTSFPALPNGLLRFDCSYNQLASLPALPQSLNMLWCGNNPLTALPALNDSLRLLYCDSTLISSIPEMPDSMYQIMVRGNPNLHCFPELKIIDYISFDSAYVHCLPNYPTTLYSSPPLSSVTLCDPFNTNGCQVYWNISGKVYNDINSNCAADVSESNIPYMKVNLYENGLLVQQNYSGGHGVYSFDTDYGTYEMSIDTTGVPFDILCPVSRFDTSVISAADSFDADKDFALQCKPGFDVGVWSVVSSNPFLPGHFVYPRIYAGDRAAFWGQHCNTNNLGGQVVTVISGPATYVPDSLSASLLPDTVNGDTLIYNIADWSAVNPEVDFNIRVRVDSSAQIGQQICISVAVTPTTGDNNLTNNTLAHCYTVISSYDPNNKEVYPVADIDTAQKWLTYTVNFQNTGNAPAEHIYVDDTLDTDIDESTFQLLSYSHQPLVQLKENAVRFTFANINLPDSSSNEPASHGFVQYKVKLKNNLPVGTVINNTAYIYFDFNAPVVTNTTTNTITTNTDVAELRMQNVEFRIFPNPCNSAISIHTENFTPAVTCIYDLNGRKIIEQKFAPQVDVSGLAKGIYFIEFKNSETSARKRFVKI